MIKMIFGMKKNQRRGKKELLFNTRSLGRQDLKTLKKYLTENLYDAWEAKINWNEFQEEK